MKPGEAGNLQPDAEGGPVARDVVYLRYGFGTDSGTGLSTRFSDVLGRVVEFPPCFVFGVNMLPGKHEIDVLESPIAKAALSFAIEYERCRALGGDLARLEALQGELARVSRELVEGLRK